MKVLIQKFGGTSLSTEENKEYVLKKILEAKKTYDNIIVVVSAMGRAGQPYATDTLLDLIEFKNTQLSSREIDMLMSCGEIISSVLIANMLLKNNIKACAMSGGTAGIITTDDYMNAEIIDVNTKNIREKLEEGYIPVIAGFQGRDNNNEITTIGRGGSDTSAAVLGEALNAEAIEIYTDVNGIMTSDPKICREAKTINKTTYAEVFQMADSGAKVIHPRAVEIARRANIPLIIKNTFTDFEGTNISAYNFYEKTLSVKEKIITSIAHISDRVQFLIDGDLDDEKFFDELANKKVSIDIINIFPNKRVFTINSNKKETVIDSLKKYSSNYSYIDDCCKVTVIGERMTGVPGVMAKIIKTLAEVDVEILQTSDSLTTISCLIKSSDLNKSVNALHKAFI